MTEQQFSTQINRLAETFGKNAFSNERVKLIWLGVKDLSPDWLKYQVDSMIGSMRHAPLLPDFVEAARFERNREHEERKLKENQFQTEKWVSMFTSEEERMFAQTIVKRLNKEISDADFANFLVMMDDMARVEKKQAGRVS